SLKAKRCLKMLQAKGKFGELLPKVRCAPVARFISFQLTRPPPFFGHSCVQCSSMGSHCPRKTGSRHRQRLSSIAWTASSAASRSVYANWLAKFRKPFNSLDALDESHLVNHLPDLAG